MTAVRAIEARELDLVEPLWRALHSHHAPMAGELPPVRPVEDSWRRRRAQYEAWLTGGDAVILVAEDSGRAVGYAAVRVTAGPATWEVGEVAAELETLSVLPESRGGGVGRELLEAARAAALARGATTLFVGVAAPNDGAIRFYSREGFRPFYELLWQEL